MACNKTKNFYYGSIACLATMHEKEHVIAPCFANELAMQLRVPSVNTDVLGTFSGEVARSKNTIETAIEKARMGIAASGLSVGIANEGSFGPHPLMPLVYSDTELIVFVDDAKELVLHDVFVSYKTNFAHIVLDKPIIDQAFLKSVCFPSHGLIVKSSVIGVCKGIRDYEILEKTIKKSFAASPETTVQIETDMRAHMNPTRMKVIAKLAQQFAKRIATICPNCNMPGFGKLEVEKGLPCADCELPTHEIKNKYRVCSFCFYTKKIVRVHAPLFANPAQCAECNP
jgi:hypothetical protein